MRFSSYVSMSKVPSVPASFVNKVVDNSMSNDTIDLFHARIDHSSVSKSIHISDCKHLNVSHFFL